MGKAKKILAGVLIAAIVTGGTYAGLQAVKKQNIKPVNVCKVSELAETYYYDGEHHWQECDYSSLGKSS